MKPYLPLTWESVGPNTYRLKRIRHDYEFTHAHDGISRLTAHLYNGELSLSISKTPDGTTSNQDANTLQTFGEIDRPTYTGLSDLAATEYRALLFSM
tara:strand:- start:61 stop:351 length:291 start_codon:yes stop_codon:yes gene_type:complete